MNLFKIDGEQYFIDLDKFMSYVTHLTSQEKNNDTEITQTYTIGGLDDDESETTDNSLSLIQKQVTENKSNGNDSLYNVKYDFLKLILNAIISPTFDESGIPSPVKSIEDMSFGQILCFNTLINKGIIQVM